MIKLATVLCLCLVSFSALAEISSVEEFNLSWPNLKIQAGLHQADISNMPVEHRLYHIDVALLAIERLKEQLENGDKIKTGHRSWNYTLGMGTLATLSFLKGPISNKPISGLFKAPIGSWMFPKNSVRSTLQFAALVAAAYFANEAYNNAEATISLTEREVISIFRYLNQAEAKLEAEREKLASNQGLGSSFGGAGSSGAGGVG